MSQKIPKKFTCGPCHYTTCNKKDFAKHLSTRKHENRINPTLSSSELGENPILHECHCGNKYKHRSSLYAHRKQCNKPETYQKLYVDTSCNDEDVNYKELFIKMLQENNEMKNIIIKQNEHISELIPKVGNNNTTNNITNNKVSIKVFLNERCKDAISMDDFLNNMTVSLENLFYTRKKGLADGLSNIFIENLSRLPITQRPIHCTDLKRETIYIKNDSWEKDENQTKTKAAIKRASGIQIKNIHKFKEANPNCMQISKQKDEYMEVIKATTDDVTEIENKIIKNVCKSIYINDKLID